MAFLFKQTGPDGTVTILKVPGITVNCNEPPEEPMNDSLDYEPVIPTDELMVSGNPIYITHLPFQITLEVGVRISSPFPGAGTITVDIFAAGQSIFISPIVMNGETQLIPWQSIKPQYRTIGAGVRLDLKIINASGVDPYSLWKGLRTAFIYRSVTL